jgi:glutaredoxin-like protein
MEGNMLRHYGLDMAMVESKFKNLKDPLKLIFFSRETNCTHCSEARKIYEMLVSISQKLEFEYFNFNVDEEKNKKYRIFSVPAVAVTGKRDYGIRYYGYPHGLELNDFIDDLVYVSRGEVAFNDTVTDKLYRLKAQVYLKVFISSSCPYSIPVAKTVIKLAVASDNINADIIDAIEFMEISEKYDVRGIPVTVVNNRTKFYGAFDDEEYLDRVLQVVQSYN